MNLGECTAFIWRFSSLIGHSRHFYTTSHMHPFTHKTVLQLIPFTMLFLKKAYHGVCGLFQDRRPLAGVHGSTWYVRQDLCMQMN